MNKLKIDDIVYFENNYDVTGKVIKIRDDNVLIEYVFGYDYILEWISLDLFKYSEGSWELPNWVLED